MKSKKLYQVALYTMDGDGNVTEIENPQWISEVSKDRVKARVLADRFEGAKEWHVAVLQEKDFRHMGFQ